MIMFQKYAALSTILLMSFIDYLSIGLVCPMFSTMLFGIDGHLVSSTTSLAVRGLWLGAILSLMPMAQIFSGPLLGTLSDRMGRKTLMLASIPFGVLGYTVAVFGVLYDNIQLLALSRIMIGIAAGNEAVGCAALADMSTPKEKAKLFGLMSMSEGFGFTIGPFLGGKLSTMNMGIYSGYAIPFLFAGLLCLINLAFVVFLFKETHKSTQRKSSVLFVFSSIKKAWRVPGFFGLFGTVFLYTFGYSFYWEFIPTLWIITYAFNVEMVGNRQALGAAVYALSSGLLIRPLEARFKSKKILFYVLILGAISLGLPFLFALPWLFWIYISIQEGIIALIYPEITALVSNSYSDDIQGEMMGVFQAVRSLALVVSPLVAGSLLGFTVKMPMIVGAWSLLLAAFILWFSQRTRCHT